MDRKILRMQSSFRDLAFLMDVSYSKFRNEVSGNANLMGRLKSMGWHSYQRFRREHVLEIFNEMGYSDGYEWYKQYQS